MDETMTSDAYATELPAPEATVNTEPPAPEPSRAEFVKRTIARIISGRKFHKSAFDRMEEDIKFSTNAESAQAGGDSDKYVANLVQRHIQERTSVLYAKNPRCRAKRRQRLDYQIWDGSPQSLAMAEQAMTAAAQSGDPVAVQNAAATALPLLQDIQQGHAQRQMLDRVGKALVIMFQHSLDSTDPTFKKQFKDVTKRTIQTGIGWVRMNFVRAYEQDASVTKQINDITEQISRIERLAGELADGQIENDSADLEELNQALIVLKAKQDVIVEEGVVYTYPASDAVIVDPRTTNITTFKGCGWMAEEFFLTPDEIEEIYGVRIGSRYKQYTETVDPDGRVAMVEAKGGDTTESLARVWDFFDKPTRMQFAVCEGYDDYLEPPRPPKVNIRRFFPFFSLTFNATEKAKGKAGSVYPNSDVRILMHAQKEYNRRREAERQHRIASSPFYISTAGTLEEDDKTKLSTRLPHDVLDLKGLPPGTKAGDLIQAAPTIPIDPNFYEAESVFADMARQTGQQAANFGGESRETSATEASISEGSRVSTLSSATDDTDECLSELASAFGEVALLEYSPETVKRIAGPGAVWPQFSGQDVSEQLYIEIIAGSSGRPNRAADLANLERGAPFLVQIPGINPYWLAKQYVTTLDDSVDLEEAIIEGNPSILAMNAMASKPVEPPMEEGEEEGGEPQPGTGDEDDQTQQGGQGANNAPRGQQRPGGPQPAFPAPAPAGQGFV